MATSIDKSVNWRKSADTPDYQVAARRVDTFVQPQRNTKGDQVAEALNQAAGVISNVGKQQAQAQKEALRKATALQKDQARVDANAEAALFNEAQKEQSYNEDSTFDGIFGNVYAEGSDARTRLNDITNKYKDNPEALATFENSFKMQTEAPTIKAIGSAVAEQKFNAISALMPPEYATQLENHNGDKDKAFRATESTMFKKLTNKVDGYGLKPSLAADMLGKVFLNETITRDSNGFANTYNAEKYIELGKGSNEMRVKLQNAITTQTRYAASERSNQRTEDKIAEDAITAERTTALMDGTWATSDSDILANTSLTDAQKIQLVNTNRAVKQQNSIAATPELKAEAKRLFYSAKRDLTYAAISGDYTAFGFTEKPSVEELEDKLAKMYFGKMANVNDFNTLVASASEQLDLSNHIDKQGSTKVLNVRVKQLSGQFEASMFTRNMRKYSQEVLDNVPWETHLNQEFSKEVHEQLQEHVKGGGIVSDGTLSSIYDSAANKVMQPIIDYANADPQGRKTIREEGLNEQPPKVGGNVEKLTAPNAKGLSMWEAYAKANGGYPSEAFLASWDARGLERVSEAPTDTPEELEAQKIEEQDKAIREKMEVILDAKNEPSPTQNKRTKAYQEAEKALEGVSEEKREEIINQYAEGVIEALEAKLPTFAYTARPEVKEFIMKIRENPEAVFEDTWMRRYYDKSGG